MPHLSPLLLIQATLVVVGVTFQIIAMRSMRGHASSGGPSPEPRETWREKKAELSRTRSGGPPRDLPTRQKQDYYEMELTPPGVRPADLRKTARVKYVDDFKAPPPNQEGDR
jgi:hypothetical protein